MRPAPAPALVLLATFIGREMRGEKIFDGHNGMSATIFSKENLLNHVMNAIPQGIDREEWLRALPRALVVGFVKTDIEGKALAIAHYVYWEDELTCR
ncbi:hypothetical protein Syun_020964 [Stephania yunnanensis]|uniref:Uncharacterized protein n=1 Tax=Stephania yunnanensis TaxID=152371 RepID=A0AAP0IGR4_9MAGN